MEEIKIGEYFRSKSIGIMKFVYGTSYITKDNKEDYIYYLEYENHKTMPLSAKGLKDMKHSLNIIDLIELGDYVNGIEVINIYEKEQECFLGYCDEKTLELKNDIYETIPNEYLITNEQIKEVVTKEYFNNGKFEV